MKLLIRRLQAWCSENRTQCQCSLTHTNSQIRVNFVTTFTDMSVNLFHRLWSHDRRRDRNAIIIIIIIKSSQRHLRCSSDCWVTFIKYFAHLFLRASISEMLNEAKCLSQGQNIEVNADAKTSFLKSDLNSELSKLN